MSIEFDASMKFINTFIQKNGGLVSAASDEESTHRIAFRTADREFELTYKRRDGRHLYDNTPKDRIDVYDHLYGYRGKDDDVEGKIAWMRSAPGRGSAAQKALLPIMLEEYLSKLE